MVPMRALVCCGSWREAAEQELIDKQVEIHTNRSQLPEINSQPAGSRSQALAVQSPSAG
jgi:hypothetical protein